MAESSAVDKAKGSIAKVTSGLGSFVRDKSARVAERGTDLAASTRERASETIEKLTDKQPDPYEIAIAEYNGAFTAVNDKGLALLRERERSADVIALVERLVNSIANTPKVFAADLEEVEVGREHSREAQEIARKDLDAARQYAALAGVGFTAGAAVASIAPSAALWVATTFGTASTGTAISTLSGVAATNAALAWLGGGALSAGGGGIAAGGALLALAGPIGWTIAGATLLTSIALLARKGFMNRKAKEEALAAIKQNTALMRDLDARLCDLLERTALLRESLVKSFEAALPLFGADFAALATGQQSQLAALVNNTKACAVQLSIRIQQESDRDA